MRFTLLLAAAICLAGCRGDEGRLKPASTEPATTEAAPVEAGFSRPLFPLRVQGTGFVDTEGQPFPWRGITAFRLAEMIAGGREADAAGYLDWAAKEQLTVVRVLLMAKHLFALTPDAGRAALPKVLDLAKARGMAVEIVAFADTKEYAFDHEAHIREIGRIAAEKGNAFVEIANEPGHPTQDERLHDPAYVKRLADLVPAPVVVALGSIEYGDGYAAGDYVTTHVPRGEGAWEHVLNVGAGAARVSQFGKPVISDEPMGAAGRLEPGRRDNDPARFAAAAALTRFAGMGATFHYEGGLHGRRAEGQEAACLTAWRSGLALVDRVPLAGTFLEGDRAAQAATSPRARRVYARMSATQAAVLVVGEGPLDLVWTAGWKEIRRAAVPGALVAVAVRDAR